MLHVTNVEDQNKQLEAMKKVYDYITPHNDGLCDDCKTPRCRKCGKSLGYPYPYDKRWQSNSIVNAIGTYHK